MANRNRGEATVRIGRKNYVLRSSFEALSAIEDALDIGIIELAGRLNDGRMRLSDLVAIIAACTAAASDEPPSEEAIGAAIAKKGIATYLEPVSTFFVAALAGGAEGNAEAAEKASG